MKRNPQVSGKLSTLQFEDTGSIAFFISRMFLIFLALLVTGNSHSIDYVLINEVFLPKDP